MSSALTSRFSRLGARQISSLGFLLSCIGATILIWILCAYIYGRSGEKGISRFANSAIERISRWPWEPAILLGVIFAVYHRTIGLTFFADDFYVLNLISEGPLKAVLPFRNLYHYFPVFLLFVGIPRWLGIGEPSLYHVLNILIHFANSILVYLIARDLLRSRFHAWGAAFIFSFFFLSYDPVLWPLGGNLYVASLFFSMMSFWSFIQYRAKGSRRYLWSFLVFYVVSIYTNELTVPIIGACLLCDLTQGHAGRSRFSLKDLIPLSKVYMGPTVAVAALWIIKYSFTLRIMVVRSSCLKSAQNFVSATCFLSPFNNMTAYWLFSRIGQNRICLMSAFAAIVFILAVCFVKSDRGPRVALAWAFLCVLPAILLAELSPRYFYIPAAGWSIFWAGSAQAAITRMAKRVFGGRQGEFFEQRRALLGFLAAGLIYLCIALQGYRHVTHLIDIWVEGSEIIQEATISAAKLISENPSKKNVMVVDQPVWIQKDDFYGAPLLIDSMSLPLKALLNVDHPDIRAVVYESEYLFAYFPKFSRRDLEAAASDANTLVIRYDPILRRMVLYQPRSDE